MSILNVGEAAIITISKKKAIREVEAVKAAARLDRANKAAACEEEAMGAVIEISAREGRTDCTAVEYKKLYKCIQNRADDPEDTEASEENEKTAVLAMDILADLCKTAGFDVTVVLYDRIEVSWKGAVRKLSAI